METAIILFGDSLKAQARPWLEELGKSDGERLRKLLDFSRTPKIRLSDALASLFPGDDTQTGLANLTRLRNRLNEAGEGIGVRCEADTKKKSPPEEREVWFTGPDATVVRVTQFSKEVTADVEGRAFVPSKGIATTGSAMAAGKRLVRFFVSYAHEDKTLVESLMKALRTLFGASKGYELEFWTDHAIMVGEQWNGRILRAIADSDFGLFMVSPAFLGSRYIGENEIPPFVEGKDCKPVIPVGLATISLDRHDLKGLQEKQIFFKGQRTYDHMHRTVDKSDFAHLLFLEIEKRLDAWFAGTGDAGKAECGEDEETLGLQAGVPAVLRTSAGCPSEEEVQRWMRVPEETRHFQRTKGLAHHLARRESLDPAKASLGEARDALDELEAWALRADGAPFFALLGEVGIGKTTTLKQFTRLLIEKRQKEPGKKYPLPIYIDLRDYVADAPGAVPTIEELLTSVIQRAWRVADRTITAADLLRLVRQENALIIFDGLDEKIVHLTQDRARDFIRT
ncbi:MAG TPA: TIR domain-containing protein, partial [Prosthecobacter sp.]